MTISDVLARLGGGMQGQQQEQWRPSVPQQPWGFGASGQVNTAQPGMQDILQRMQASGAPGQGQGQDQPGQGINWAALAQMFAQGQPQPQMGRAFAQAGNVPQNRGYLPQGAQQSPYDRILASSLAQQRLGVK